MIRLLTTYLLLIIINPSSSQHSTTTTTTTTLSSPTKTFVLTPTGHPSLLRVANDSSLVLKQVTKKFEGIRELHFLQHLSTYDTYPTLYEWWFSESTMSMNFLLSDSGRSLSSLIYEGNHPVRRSAYWYELRRNSHHLMRDMVTSLINTVAFLHSREIYHRDIKPDNILIGDRGQITLVDFGSAWDEYISRHGLFGTTGPSEKEETARYSPPEFRWSYSIRSSSVDEFAAYDAWSLGATLLEIYIGTPHALTDPTFENALISLCLFDSYDEISRLKFILNKDNDQENKNSITVRKRCDANVFRQRLQLFDEENDDEEEVQQEAQDKDHLLIDLIYRLLDPNPKSRMRIDRAIHDHAYFNKDMFRWKNYTFTTRHERDAWKKSMTLCQEEEMEVFRCEHCHRVFEDIRECDRHVQSRNHGTYCRVKVLRHCHHEDHSIVIRDNINIETRRRKMWSTFEHIGGRERMEDFLLVDEEMGVVAVFDGHEGDIVARTVRDTIRNILRDEPNMRLDHVLQYVQERSMSTMLNYPQQGTTATVVRVIDNKLEIANLGDSSAIMCCDEFGHAIELTENHNAEKNAKERERIYRAGGHVSESFRVENRLMITRALGDIWGRHVGISSIPFYQIKPLDDAKFVVLASDGVWDYVSFEMVKDIVKDTLLSSIDEVATEVGRAVKVRAKASGGRSDNMAVVVLVLTG